MRNVVELPAVKRRVFSELRNGGEEFRRFRGADCGQGERLVLFRNTVFVRVRPGINRLQRNFRTGPLRIVVPDPIGRGPAELPPGRGALFILRRSE